MSARLHRLAKRFQARTKNTDRLQKLIAFAALLGEADFRPLLDAAAIGNLLDVADHMAEINRRPIPKVPALRGNAVLGGSVMGGILASLLYGVHTFARGPSPAADWAFFFAMFTMGWVNLIILLGWTHERAVGRIAGACLSTAAGLVRGAFARGVAR